MSGEFTPEPSLVAAVEGAVLARHGRIRGEEIVFRCIFPDRHKNGDRDPAASYNRAKHVWTCHACGAEGGLMALATELGLVADKSAPRAHARVVARCDYTDQSGALLYQVERLEPKSFRQRRPAPDGTGRWIFHLDPDPKCDRARYGCACRDFPNLEPVRRVLYRLPEVLAVARQGWRIYVTEGEKDADAICALGLMATTNAMGAGKWRPEYTAQLAGAEVVVVADKDAKGREHAREVATSCAS